MLGGVTADRAAWEGVLVRATTTRRARTMTSWEAMERTWREKKSWRWDGTIGQRERDGQGGTAADAGASGARAAGCTPGAHRARKPLGDKGFRKATGRYILCTSGRRLLGF